MDPEQDGSYLNGSYLNNHPISKAVQALDRAGYARIFSAHEQLQVELILRPFFEEYARDYLDAYYEDP